MSNEQRPKQDMNFKIEPSLAERNYGRFVGHYPEPKNTDVQLSQQVGRKPLDTHVPVIIPEQTDDDGRVLFS